MRRLVWLLLPLLTGCIRPTQAVMEDVNPYGWEEMAAVEIENGDTATLRDLNLVIRANRDFRADSLHLELTLINPDSAYYAEEVSLAMQHRRMPAALRMTDEIPYRRSVVLNRMGSYRLVIRPLKEVEGVEAVGINIVKSEIKEEL